tara:strand:- start:1603 stop:3384 length:1782 start_codon:yes stop_codon:yes gene_type:complete
MKDINFNDFDLVYFNLSDKIPYKKIEQNKKIIIVNFYNNYNHRKNFRNNITVINFGSTLNSNFYFRKFLGDKENLNFVNKKLFSRNYNSKLNWIFKKIYSEQLNLVIDKNISEYFKKFFRCSNFINYLNKKKNIKIYKVILNKSDYNFLRKHKVPCLNSFKEIIVINDYFKFSFKAFYPFLISIFSLFINGFRSNRNFRIGHRVYNSGMRVNINDENRLDWMSLNNLTEIKKILFIEENQITDINFYSKNLLKKLNLIKFKKFRPVTYCSIEFFLKNLFLYLPLSLIISILLTFINYRFLDLYIKGWYSFLRWNSLLSFVSFKKYFTYHDYSINHIFRNILLKKKKINTILYNHTHTEDFFHNNKYASVNYFNAFYDEEIHWSKASKKMSLSNFSKSKKHLILGPANFSKKSNFNDKTEKRIIFFNTSFKNGISDNVNGFIEHLQFYKFVLDTCGKFLNYKIILKSKNSLQTLCSNKKLNQVIKKLNKNKNFTFIHKSKYFNLLAKSEICISMPFSSPVFFLLNTNKKLFYLDLTKKFSASYFNLNNFYFSNYKEALKYMKKKGRKISNKKLVNKFISVSHVSFDSYIKKKIN